MSGGHETPTSAAAIAADREAFRVFLREHNLPATAQRLAIADVVLGTDRHLSADDVARELRAHGARARARASKSERTWSHAFWFSGDLGMGLVLATSNHNSNIMDC